MAAAVAGSSLAAKYTATSDRESAREMLAARLEAGRQGAGRADDREGGDLVSEVLKSRAAKEFMRTAAREIARGVFKIAILTRFDAADRFRRD